MTTRLVDHVERMALKKTFADVSEETGLNERTIRRITTGYISRLEAAHVFQTPIWLGLDEIHLGKVSRGVVAKLVDSNWHWVQKGASVLAPSRQSEQARLPQGKRVQGQGGFSCTSWRSSHRLVVCLKE